MHSVRASLLLFAAAPMAHAAVVWNEAVNGDLSNNRLAPTPVALSPGVNSLLATTSAGDREFVRLTIPAAMTALIQVSWQSQDQTGFIAMQSGPTFTEDPSFPNVANMLGYSHYGPGLAALGSDILPDIGAGAGSIGFTPPLPAGTYTIWLNQTGLAATYQLDFIVAPTPATLLPLLALTALRRRRAL